jgi:Trypsin-like peptidase domain
VPKISRGSVGTVPITPLPTGASWAFEPFAFAPPLPSQEWPEGEYTIDNWEHFGGVLLSMMITDGRTAYVHGSAVMVAPGVAIAARHIVEEFLPKLTLATGGPSLSCVSITADQAVIWTCNTMTLVGNDSDLMILMLAHASEMPKDNLFRLAMVTTRLPTVGERVLMVGFTASEDEIPASPSNVTVTGHIRVSTGIIKERYPTGRDLVMLPGPAVQVATSASGGMSGGPVFDQNGLLFGIVSTSYGQEDHVGPTFVSLIWPALTIPITPIWPPGVHIPGRRLHEFGQLCSIDRPDMIVKNGETEFTYRIWE